MILGTFLVAEVGSYCNSVFNSFKYFQAVFQVATPFYIPTTNNV